MKKIELTGVITTGLLIVLRLVFGTAINPFLMIMLVLLAIFYMWSGFFLFNDVDIKKLFSHQKNISYNGYRITGSIIMGLVYSFAVISTMFALCFYAKMNTVLFISILLTFSSSILIIIYGLYRETDVENRIAYIRQFFIRSAAYGLLCLFIFLTPVEKRLDILFRNHPGYIDAYKDFLENPDDPNIKEELRKQRNLFR